MSRVSDSRVSDTDVRLFAGLANPAKTRLQDLDDRHRDGHLHDGVTIEEDDEDDARGEWESDRGESERGEHVRGSERDDDERDDDVRGTRARAVEAERGEAAAADVQIRRGGGERGRARGAKRKRADARGGVFRWVRDSWTEEGERV